LRGAMSRAKQNKAGMILLPRTSSILEQTVRHQLEMAQEVKNQDPSLDSKKKKKMSSVMSTFIDFEQSAYRVEQNPKASSIMSVSLNLPCYKQIKDNGVDDALQAKFGDMVAKPADGYDVTIAVDTENPGRPVDEMVALICSLKETILTAPLMKYFDALLKGSPLKDIFAFDLRTDCRFYMVPRSDRVICVVRLSLEDPVDLQIAEIFLKDYKEVQRRKVPQAPPAMFSVNPPTEIKSLTGEGKGNLGFISFSCEKQALRNPLNSAAALVNFRTFLQYHIKCSKAYFHSRMRKKVRQFQKVLNRAKVNAEGETKRGKKKLASGKTFKKK